MQLIETKPPDSNEPHELAQDVRANRYDLLSRLADDLAHEIKNPLNAVVVNLEVMRRRVQTGHNDLAFERADVIEHELRRVHGLVDQLLQLLRPAKAESGPMAVDGILDSLMGAVQLQAKASRVILEWETESSLFAQVRSEPFRFALLNVLTYAIDSEAKAGGAIRVTARRTGEDIYLVVDCTRAALALTDEHIKQCQGLMRAAGGVLESVEPGLDGFGSTVTLALPRGKFG